MIIFVLAIAAGWTVGQEPLVAPIVPVLGQHFFTVTVPNCRDLAARGEVLICGRKSSDDRYRLRPIETEVYVDEAVRAEVKLGTGTLAAHVEDGPFGSKRAMITFTLPF